MRGIDQSNIKHFEKLQTQQKFDILRGMWPNNVNTLDLKIPTLKTWSLLIHEIHKKIFSADPENNSQILLKKRPANTK